MQLPSAYLRPQFPPGGAPVIDERGAVNLLDAASIRYAAERERPQGDEKFGEFSMGLQWVCKAAANAGIELPEGDDLLSAWFFPWSQTFVEPDGQTGRWRVLHDILRGYLNRQAVIDLGPYIEQTAMELVRQNVQQQLRSGATTVGVFDVAAYGNTLAFRVISELSGFPHDAATEAFMQEHLDDIARRANFVEALRPEAEAVRERIWAIVDERRNAPGDSLLKRIINACDNDVITAQELVGLVLGLWHAGTDTTATATPLLFGLVDEAGLTQTMVATLNERTGEWRKKAIHEALRLGTPFPLNPTVTTREVTLPNGYVIPALTTVNLHWAAANRDPAVYGDTANEYIPGRGQPTHVAFGYSVHQCLGKQLALAEVDLAAVAAYGSLPNLKLVEWRRAPQLVDTVSVATFEYDLRRAARNLGL